MPLGQQPQQQHQQQPQPEQQQRQQQQQPVMTMLFTKCWSLVRARWREGRRQLDTKMKNKELIHEHVIDYIHTYILNNI